MRKTSVMYQLSGGTDYRHTCYECRNCQKVKKSRYTCRLYEEGGGTGDWNPHVIACKFFNADHLPERMRAKQGQQDTLPQDDGIQMTIADFCE